MPRVCHLLPLRGFLPSEPIKQRLAEVFAEVVKESPEVLIIPGIENWIIRAVLGTVRNNGWGIAETRWRGGLFCSKPAAPSETAEAAPASPDQISIQDLDSRAMGTTWGPHGDRVPPAAAFQGQSERPPGVLSQAEFERAFERYSTPIQLRLLLTHDAQLGGVAVRLLSARWLLSAKGNEG